MIRGLLVKAQDADRIVQRLQAQNIGGFMVPDVPSVMHMYAGEIPWCDTYAANEWDGLPFARSQRPATESIDSFMESSKKSGV